MRRLAATPWPSSRSSACSVTSRRAPVLLPWADQCRRCCDLVPRPGVRQRPGRRAPRRPRARRAATNGVAGGRTRPPPLDPAGRRPPQLPGVHPRGQPRLRPRQTQPAFSFGHGLGYSTWDYLDLTAPPRLDPTRDAVMTVRLRNTGTRPGREVVQVYASAPDSAVERPARWLVGFAGASADPGQEVTVQVTVPARSLAHWDGQTHTWTIEQGRLRLAVGPPTATNASPSRSRPAPEAPLSW
jgi:hypothetical protein